MDKGIGETIMWGLFVCGVGGALFGDCSIGVVWVVLLWR